MSTKDTLVDAHYTVSAEAIRRVDGPDCPGEVDVVLHAYQDVNAGAQLVCLRVDAPDYETGEVRDVLVLIPEAVMGRLASAWLARRTPRGST